MAKGSFIKHVEAREVFSDRGHPGVEATVVTENGASGVALVTAGTSVGKYEVKFSYDGGERWGGLGVQKAVRNIEDVIAPAIIGKDATEQRDIDGIMLEMDGTPDKSNLGGNATAAVSAATLKAGAASLGLPLYKHIGGVNACILPTPGAPVIGGADRYGGGERAGSKPTYTLMCYGFDTFSEASYACWQIKKTFENLFRDKYRLFGLRSEAFERFFPPPGLVDHDRVFWDMMVQAIDVAGMNGKVGIQVDVAAGCYYDKEKDAYVGLFSREDKSRDDLISLYNEMVANYPFVILEDPLDEDDYAGHAIVTKELGIQIVGDDLFTTNMERLKKGVAVGAANTVLLKVNQIGSITEAFDMVQMAYRHGYGVMPCSSRGEGVDIGDYAVGLSTGNVRECGIGVRANRLLKIERELGPRAVFLGKAGFKMAR